MSFACNAPGVACDAFRMSHYRGQCAQHSGPLLSLLIMSVPSNSPVPDELFFVWRWSSVVVFEPWLWRAPETSSRLVMDLCSARLAPHFTPNEVKRLVAKLPSTINEYHFFLGFLSEKITLMLLKRLYHLYQLYRTCFGASFTIRAYPLRSILSDLEHVKSIVGQTTSPAISSIVSVVFQVDVSCRQVPSRCGRKVHLFPIVRAT